jgi:2-dehydro-3-deoxy-D-gluconate 5-dehydrogenase
MGIQYRLICNSFLMKHFDLTDRVAIVTGGNGGIGLGMATGLASAGAFVVVAARNREKANDAVAELEALGGKAAFLGVDVADESSVTEMIDTAAKRWGRLDILINNAGTSVRKTPQELTLDEWRRVMDTNVTSVFMACKASYPHMKQQGCGKIINIGSMMSLFGSSIAAAYSASKGGVVQLTKSLAAAWAPDNIQVNAVLPGWIETELTAPIWKHELPGMHERISSRIPAGDWGKGDDLAGIAVFLASEASDYVTGAAIPVDGGYSSQGL